MQSGVNWSKNIEEAQHSTKKPKQANQIGLLKKGYVQQLSNCPLRAVHQYFVQKGSQSIFNLRFLAMGKHLKKDTCMHGPKTFTKAGFNVRVKELFIHTRRGSSSDGATMDG